MTAAALPRPAFPYLSEYAARPVAHLATYSDAAVLEAEPEVETTAELLPYWSGVIGMEDQLTGDGRLIEGDALTWTTPIPFRFVKEDVGAHDGAVAAGRILSITRGEGGRIEAHGDFDLGSPEGREAARLTLNGIMNGVSMDLDSVEFEVRVAAEVIEAQDAFWEALEGDREIEEPARETDGEGRVIVYKGSPDDEVMVTTGARVRAATLVSIPAFAEAVIEATASLPEEIMALVASAAPVEPPRAWFFRPEADGPTALTITDDGHVYGHLATWDTCHIGDPSGMGNCVMAPKSKSGYAYFHTGAVRTAEGEQVPTGTIRFNTGHAPLRAAADSAAAHYDNTGLAGADVHVTDGKHGVWVSGALRPGLSPEQVRTLRAAPLSGDWRYIQGKLELVGALAVNLPGFPVPRTQGLVASGELTGLVAAGMIAPRYSQRPMLLSVEDQRYLKRLADRERESEAAEVTALRQRVDNAANLRKIEAMATKLKVSR